MNAAHLHLVVNHLPLAALALGLVLFAVSAAWRGADFRKGAMVLFAVAAVTTAPTYFSGEPAEEVVEHLPGVSRSDIHEHEEAAEGAAVAAALTGVAALLTLILEARGRPAARRVAGATIILALVSAVLMGRAANLGGSIRHSEIRAAGSAEPGDGERH